MGLQADPYSAPACAPAFNVEHQPCPSRPRGLTLAAACADSHRFRRTHARGMRPLLRLPALWLLPGQMPTHEASRFALPGRHQQVTAP